MQETDGKAVDLIAENPMFPPQALKDRLAEMIGGFRMPKWVVTGKDGEARKCPECGKPLSQSSVREVGLCLNAQNIGDIQVEILCGECFSGYYLLFRKACKDFAGFAEAMTTDDAHDKMGLPIPNHRLQLYENNLTETMAAEAAARGAGKPCQ